MIVNGWNMRQILVAQLAHYSPPRRLLLNSGGRQNSNCIGRYRHGNIGTSNNYISSRHDHNLNTSPDQRERECQFSCYLDCLNKYASRTAISSPIFTTQPSPGGLSSGAKAGIAARMFLLIVSVRLEIYLCLRRRSKNMKGQPDEAFGYTTDIISPHELIGSSNNTRQREGGIGN